MPYDYFTAQQAIASRLMEQIPSLQSAIGSGRGLDPAIRRPAAAVFHEGHEPLGRGVGQSLFRQKWKVTLVVDSANDRHGSVARAMAGPLISQIITALDGWIPAEGHSPLAALSGGAEEYQDGVASFDLLFESGITI
ncbi:MAG: hypothetical protein OEZ55_14655 [Nitrospinota bacterium]|nr:hypothetical protein [Nitrospinota bacterium]